MSAPAPLRLQTCRSTGPELDALVPLWNALARSTGASFAARPSYALAWWEHLGRGELHVASVWRDDQLVALAPLHRRVLLGQPVLRWLGHGLGTVGEVLGEDEEALAALWDSLAAPRAALQLTHVRLDDPSTLALRRSARWQHRLVVDDRCPLLTLQPGSTASDVRSARSLKRLRNYRSLLVREDRPFDLTVIRDPIELERAWPDIQRVAEAADLGRDRENLCATPYAAFTLDFLRREAQAGSLLLLGATVGGRWVAQEIAVRSGRTLEMWLSRYEPELDRYAPGHLLMRELVDRHEELELDVFDLGLGENSYKLAWATGGYDVGTLTAAPAGLGVAQARIGMAQVTGSLARRLRR